MIATRSGDQSQVSLETVVTWAVLCGVSNVMTEPVGGNVIVSLATPVNLAIASLFPPGLAAAIVVTSSLSESEIRRQTTIAHALLTRVQLALATATASAISWHFGTGEPTVAGSLTAVLAYYVVNWGLVSTAEIAARGVGWRRALRVVVPNRAVAMFSCLALGFMGVALAEIFREIGAWAVSLLVAPLFGARLALAASTKLGEAQRAQRMLANRLIDERERERARISANIHDVVLQDLAAVRLMTGNVRSAIEARKLATAEQLAEALQAQADASVGGLRAALRDLRRSSLDDDGLARGMARYLRSFTSQTGIDVRLVTGGISDLPRAVALLVYECCQEALQNVARHASATRVDVGLQRVGSAVEITVEDDGTGSPRAQMGGGLGLALVRDKVELSGGRLLVKSSPKGGTQMRITVPLADSFDGELVDR